MNWKDYSTEELRLQYRTDLTPGMSDYMSSYESWSEQVVGKLNSQLDLPYGSLGPRQTLDIFPAKNALSPALIFIHGGFWFFNSKDSRRFPAELFVENGITWIPINYRLAPHVNMDEIVDDVRNAVAWVHKHASEYNYDPEQIFVSGNSAGGHLTAALLSDDWPLQYGLPENVIKGACAVSGIFDLEPLLPSEPNEKLNLDKEAAYRNSPIHQISNHKTPLIVSCGANESDEFKRQSAEYSHALSDAGWSVSHFELEGHNHFSIIGEFANPDSQLVKELLVMINGK